MATQQAPRIVLDVETHRVNAGMTKLELADRTGIPRTTLRGLLRNPGQLTFDQAYKIARVLNLSADAYKVVSE